jgi:hypothetical protein
MNILVECDEEGNVEVNLTSELLIIIISYLFIVFFCLYCIIIKIIHFFIIYKFM